jgi:dephospho-CoA kinase
MTFILGLTGSIGMGKSTTAQMFRDLGVPVWDADAAVHRLYAAGGAATSAIASLCPQAIAPDGAVNRDQLRAAISQNPGLLDRVSSAVHPLVAQDRQRFLQSATAPLVVLDIPLLFEAGGTVACDAVAVVTVAPDVQRARVLARGMTAPEFELILSRQMPDAQKRARADFVIQTDTLDRARSQVAEIVATLRDRRHA